MSTITFEAEWIATSLGLGADLAGKARGFERIVTDSRKVRPSDLFVAIRGEAFDGHDFIEGAIQKGATGILGEASRVEQLVSRHPSIAFLGVTDVQAAYRKLGSSWRSRFKIPVIAVAGSNGKTTTKEFLAALLQGKHASVLKTLGSQNGFLGIPMTLLDLRAHHGAAVIEIGIDDVGAMVQHIDCVRPTHAVLTVIGPEHLENLKDIPSVAREELLALSETLQIGGKIAVNLDDPWVAPTQGGLTFSLSVPAQIRGELAGADELRVTLPTGDQLTLTLPLPGRHNAQNLLAATAVAHLTGLAPSEIEAGLKKFQGAEGRSEVRRLEKPVQAEAICDYYNASPVSMKAAFELLASTGAPTARRWACLADMKELGENELQFHRELADELLATRPAGILLHGPRMESLLMELRSRGYSGVLEHHDSPEKIALSLRPRLSSGDVVLIKGSRSMKMEKTWESLVDPKNSGGSS